MTGRHRHTVRHTDIQTDRQSVYKCSDEGCSRAVETSVFLLKFQLSVSGIYVRITSYNLYLVWLLG